MSAIELGREVSTSSASVAEHIWERAEGERRRARTDLPGFLPSHLRYPLLTQLPASATSSVLRRLSRSEDTRRRSASCRRTPERLEVE